MRISIISAALAFVAIIASACSGKENSKNNESAKADTISTEMTTPADKNLTPEAAKALAQKIADKEALTSGDYNMMLDYILEMGAKMGEAMKKVDLDALERIPAEFPESDTFLRALEDAAASNKLDKDQLAKAKKFKELIGEEEI